MCQFPKEIGFMFSNRIALAALAATCVAAAGGGGYLATRHNVANLAATDASASTAAIDVPSKPVQETEALVSSPLRQDVAATTSQTAPQNQNTATPVPTKRIDAAAPPVARQQRSATAEPRKAQPPALDRSWPRGTASPAPSSSNPSTASTENQVSPAHTDDRLQETSRTPEPPAKTFEELVIASDSVIGLQTETALSSDRARIEDRVEAHVVRDVRVGGSLAIPAGSRALGTVVVVDRGGKFKERARLGIRFQTLVLADGTRLPITTETIYRYGNAPGNVSAAKIGGGAAIGAIIGGIIGGGKGAAIGATTGAGAGTASVMTSDRDAAVFTSGTEVTARVLSPVTITVEHQ
jgi:type IV secretory pathway VirB10-like protein